MEKNKAYEHMTESDKMVYDLLFEKLQSVYAENEVGIKNLNSNLEYYFKGLVDVPDTIGLNVNFSGYSTTLRIKEKDSKNWGRDLNIYVKENRDYVNNKVEIEGIEMSMSSMRFSSTKFDVEDFVHLMLCAEIAKRMDEVQSQIVRAYHVYHEMNNKVYSVSAPMDKLVRETEQRVREEQRKKVTSVIADGVTIEFKHKGGTVTEHIFIHKISKKTAHVTFFRNGWRQDEAMRFNLDDLIEKIARQDFKIVDNSEIKKLRESQN